MIVINFITGESMMKNNVLLVMHVIKLRIGNTLKLFVCYQTILIVII